jgi:hypothetical protein
MNPRCVKFPVRLSCAAALLPALMSIGCLGDADPGGPPGSPPPAPATEEVATTSQPLFDSLGNRLGPISAAIVAENERAGDWRALARIEVRPNEMVEFYSLGDRAVVITGAGRPAQSEAAAPEPTDASPRELWTALSGGRAMPQTLEDALVRVHTRRVAGATDRPRTLASPAAPSVSLPTFAPPTLSVGEDGVATAVSAVDTGFCATSYYTTNDPNDHNNKELGACLDQGFDVCWDNVVGNGSAWHNDVSVWNSNVCPRSGAVIVKVTSDESEPPTGSWTVQRNTYRWWKFTDYDCDVFPLPDDCPTIKSAVTSVGVSYNFRFNVTPS